MKESFLSRQEMIFFCQLEKAEKKRKERIFNFFEDKSTLYKGWGAHYIRDKRRRKEKESQGTLEKERYKRDGIISESVITKFYCGFYND